jgi:hypothetical protein
MTIVVQIVSKKNWMNSYYDHVIKKCNKKFVFIHKKLLNVSLGFNEINSLIGTHVKWV